MDHAPDGRRYVAPETFRTEKGARGRLSLRQSKIIRKPWVPPEGDDKPKLAFETYSPTWMAQRVASPHVRAAANHHGNPTQRRQSQGESVYPRRRQRAARHNIRAASSDGIPHHSGAARAARKDITIVEPTEKQLATAVSRFGGTGRLYGIVRAKPAVVRTKSGFEPTTPSSTPDAPTSTSRAPAARD
jgi:hypothetical protein